MQQAALQWLEREPLLHICMTECIRRGHAELLYAGRDGVVLRDPVGELLEISVDSPETLKRWLPFLKREPFDVVAHQPFAPDILAPALADRPGAMHYYHSVYTKKEPLDVVLPEGARIAPLDKRYSELAERVYTHAPPGYITGRIEAGVMLGVFWGEELAGFIGQHTEGAQGMLEIFPAYRRRGLASALMAANINAALARGETPFGQIVTDNKASLALSRSLGLEISQGIAHWFYR